MIFRGISLTKNRRQMNDLANDLHMILTKYKFCVSFCLYKVQYVVSSDRDFSCKKVGRNL